MLIVDLKSLAGLVEKLAQDLYAVLLQRSVIVLEASKCRLHRLDACFRRVPALLKVLSICSYKRR